MLPMLLRPASAAPRFQAAGYTRLWATTSKNGVVSGSASSDTGSYSVKWWDGTTSSFASGDTFTKSGSGNRAFEVYPSGLITPDSAGGSSPALFGQAQISTAQSKFGGSSAQFSGGYLAGNVTFNWSGNWTLELWFRRVGAGTGSIYTIFQAGNIGPGVGGVHLYYETSGQLVFNNGLSAAISGGTAPLNQWCHIAAVRNGTTTTLYLDGSSVGTSTQTYPVNNTGFGLGGALSYGFYSNAYIDEFRLTQSALYSGSSFTPPSSALSAISGTAALLHLDSSSLSQSGQFDAFNVSGNEISKLRAESVSLSSTPGYTPGGWYNYTNYTWVPGQYVPGTMEQGDLSNNSLNADAINQFYTDLLSGTGALYVAGNPGISADDPTIATAKGYTVYGSVPPSTSLLLNCNGANGSTTFTDSSPSGLEVTAIGSAVISTAQSKFGGASGYSSGSGQYLTLGNAAFDFGADDFTIEFWLYVTSTTESIGVFGNGRAAGNPQGINCFVYDNKLRIDGNNGGWQSPLLNSLSAISANQWDHYAITRSGGVLSFWKNGALQDTNANGAIQFPQSQPASLFSTAGDGELASHGIGIYIDDFRIIKGAALYTANFTPPTSQLTVWYS